MTTIKSESLSRVIVGFMACLLGTLPVGGLQAASNTIGYSLAVVSSGGQNAFNLPDLTFTNQSDAGISIVGLELAIGDTVKNFDFGSIRAGGGFGEIILSPDAIDGAARSDLMRWSFTGIPTGAGFTFRIDIDDDVGGDTLEDFRLVFFNNGPPANSAITVTFSNGTIALSNGSGPDAGAKFLYVQR